MDKNIYGKFLGKIYKKCLNYFLEDSIDESFYKFSSI